MKKRLAVLVVAIGLVAAACSSSATTETTTTTAETTTTTGGPDGGMPETAPASVIAEDQTSDGTGIVVKSVDLPAAGFIAVHADNDGSPGAVIGHSDLLPAGTSTDVSVVLDTPINDGSVLWPMAHIDMDEDGEYTFVPPDNAIDVPGLTADGDVAMVPVKVDVSDESSAPTAAGSEISIKNFAFGPADITISVGETVRWTNDEDSIGHTTTSDDGIWNSGMLNPGDTFEQTFTEPGTFTYFCSIHPSMTASITVNG